MYFRRSSVLLTAGLVIAGAAGAQAADLGGLKDPMHPMYAPPPGPVWYFRIDGGYGINSGVSIKDKSGWSTISGDDLDNTWSIGGGIGKYFSRNVRGDITVDYRFSSDVGGVVDNGSPPPGRLDVDLNSTVVLANLYYDFDRGTGFTPYVGAGIGFVHHRVNSGTIRSCGCVLDVDGDSDTDFAAALMAGFSWSLGRRQDVVGSTKDGPIYVESDRGWKLDVGYRFLYLGDAATGRIVDTAGPTEVSSGLKIEDIYSHEFRIGLRFDIR